MIKPYAATSCTVCTAWDETAALFHKPDKTAWQRHIIAPAGFPFGGFVDLIADGLGWIQSLDRFEERHQTQKSHHGSGFRWIHVARCAKPF